MIGEGITHKAGEKLFVDDGGIQVAAFRASFGRSISEGIDTGS